MSRAGVMSFIGGVILSLWSRTVTLRFVNREAPERLHAEGKNFIYAFWHGRQFLLLHSHRKTGVVIAASESRDGEIQAGILKRFGYEVVRGSSKRKGDRALLGMVGGLRKGKDIAIAVDGPRGPIYEVKQGTAYLAGKLKKPIVPVITGAKRCWILRRIWDQYLLPVPFTQGVVIYGDPITVNSKDEQELEAKSKELESSLNAIMAKADSYFTDRERG